MRILKRHCINGEIVGHTRKTSSWKFYTSISPKFQLYALRALCMNKFGLTSLPCRHRYIHGVTPKCQADLKPQTNVARSDIGYTIRVCMYHTITSARDKMSIDSLARRWRKTQPHGDGHVIHTPHFHVGMCKVTLPPCLCCDHQYSTMDYGRKSILAIQHASSFDRVGLMKPRGGSTERSTHICQQVLGGRAL